MSEQSKIKHAETLRALSSRFKPIYDNAFDDLLAQLNKIDFYPTKKS